MAVADGRRLWLWKRPEWWDLGDHWSGGERFNLCWFQRKLWVSKLDARVGTVVWVEVLDPAVITYAALTGERETMSKYINQAKAAKAEERVLGGTQCATLWKDRPALQEYMTLTVHDDGTGRDVSPLMVVAVEEGVKVGLKDCETGGWCWRTGAVLPKALDALEKALAGGTATFAAPKGNGPGKGRRG